MARQLPSVFSFERQSERRKEEERLKRERKQEERKTKRTATRQEVLTRLRSIKSLERDLTSRDIDVPEPIRGRLATPDVSSVGRVRQLVDAGAVPFESRIQQDVEGELKRLGERTRTLRASKAGKEEMAKFVTGFIASNAIGKSFTIDGTRITSLDNVEEVHDFFELKAGRTAGVSYDRFDPANKELVENAVNKFLAGRPEGENELEGVQSEFRQKAPEGQERRPGATQEQIFKDNLTKAIGVVALGADPEKSKALLKNKHREDPDVLDLIEDRWDEWLVNAGLDKKKIREIKKRVKEGKRPSAESVSTDAGNISIGRFE